MACHGRLHDTAVPAPWKLSYAPCQQGFFFSFSFPTLPPSLSLFLSLSLSPSSFSFFAGKCASREEVGARQELLPRLLLSSSYWDGVNGADGWRRAIKMEGFVPPALRSGKGSPSCSLRRKHPPCLPGDAAPFPALLPADRAPAPTAALCSSEEMPFPPGTAPPRSAAAPRSKSDSNPCCPPAPESSLCREQGSKELIKAWEISRDIWGEERNEEAEMKESLANLKTNIVCQTFPTSFWFLIPWKLQPLSFNLNILISVLVVWFPKHAHNYRVQLANTWKLLFYIISLIPQDTELW